jgi:hypothetical protein
MVGSMPHEPPENAPNRPNVQEIGAYLPQTRSNCCAK